MLVPMMYPWSLSLRATSSVTWVPRGGDRYSLLPHGGVIACLFSPLRQADAFWHPSQCGWRYAGSPFSVDGEFHARPEGPVLGTAGVARALAAQAGARPNDPSLSFFLSTLAEALGDPESLLVALSVMES